MDFLNKLLSQLGTLWNRWTAAQRAGLVVATLACGAAIVGVGMWASTPEYVALTDGLSPQQAAQAVSQLESSGIKYKLNFAGSAVSVPRSDMGKARLALKDLLTSEAAPGQEISDGIWADPATYQARMTRQLETRLAKSIQQMSGVRGATVHLTQPKSSPFTRDRSDTKASVVLELHPQTQFSIVDARSIVSLLAHSVERLSPENVSVVDTQGRLLSSAGGVESVVSHQLEYRSQVEATLANKAETILTQMLGPGKAVVRVTADIDFTEVERKETRYDPDGKVKLSENVRTETNSGPVRLAGGPPGRNANDDSKGGLEFKPGGGGGNSKVQDSDIKYQNPQTDETRREAPGKIQRITVAVVADLAAPLGPDGKPVASAKALSKEQVQQIVESAVGFNTTRGDLISVLDQALAGNTNLIPVAAVPTLWDTYGQLLRTASLGIAAIVALLLGMLVIRRLQPIVVESSTAEDLPRETIFRLAEISQQAREEPERAAAVIRAWLEQSAEETTQERGRRAA